VYSKVLLSFIDLDIDQALEHVDRINFYVEAAKISPDALTDKELRVDYKSFIASVEKVNGARQFFEENSEFQGVTKAMKNLVSFCFDGVSF
jgi:hypothetical protein